MLAERSLHELNMESVAKAAGVGKPVLYTAFRTRTELVTALFAREYQHGLAQVRVAMPDDVSVIDPTYAYTAIVSAYIRAVLENPTRWALILTVPDTAPRAYRAAVRTARSQVVIEAQELVRAGSALDPRLADLDVGLLGHTMLSFAEMLGRLAVVDPDRYPRERLERYATEAMRLFTGLAPLATT